MRKYTAEKYIELVENIDDEILQAHMKTEIDIISKVKDSRNKTFIDLGAGHGRLLPDLVKIAGAPTKNRQEGGFLVEY